MNEIQLKNLDLNLLVVFDVLMEERSVTRAAERLGKTASAVSHALGRLRDQLGDPLMVKVGSGMQPSPFAEALIKEVRPILQSLQRVVQPMKPFEPGTSERVFRLGMVGFSALISDVAARVSRVAPHVGLEWISPSAEIYPRILDGQIDLALIGAATTLPDGLSHHDLPPLRRYTFCRDGHPALSHWDEQAWLRWPHVMVGLANAARQTVEERVAKLGLDRRIGALVPHVSGVAPLLAHTDMLANNIPLFLLDDLDPYTLRVLAPPVPLPDLSLRFYWSTRLSSDPGNRWIREVVIGSVTDLLKQADAWLENAKPLAPVAAG